MNKESSVTELGHFSFAGKASSDEPGGGSSCRFSFTGNSSTGGSVVLWAIRLVEEGGSLKVVYWVARSCTYSKLGIAV